MLTPQERKSVYDRLSRGRRAGDCWLWLGRDDKPSKRGWYTTVVVGGRRYNLRRLLFALHRGLPDLPPRKTVLRSTCRNPKCVNPKHVLEINRAKDEGE